MRTHELASVLRSLSDALKYMPDTEIASLPEVLKSSPNYLESLSSTQVAEEKLSASATASIDDIHDTLKTLTKKEIMALIVEADISVEVQGKDSAKYTANKVRNHLTKHPRVTRKVRSIIRRKHSVTALEPLSKALGILLGDNDEVSATGS